MGFDVTGVVGATGQIVIGENKTLNIRLVQTDGTPYDLTGASPIVVNLRNADGTVQSKTASIAGNPVLGNLSAVYAPADTALLQAGLLLTVEVQFTVGGLLTIVEIPNAIDVIDDL